MNARRRNVNNVNVPFNIVCEIADSYDFKSRTNKYTHIEWNRYSVCIYTIYDTIERVVRIKIKLLVKSSNKSAPTGIAKQMIPIEFVNRSRATYVLSPSDEKRRIKNKKGEAHMHETE